MGVDLLHLWTQMGNFAKGVVIIMAIMSIYSVTVMITKLIQLKRSESATRRFAPQFSRAIQEENLDQAISLAEKNKVGHVARVLGGALGEVKPLDLHQGIPGAEGGHGQRPDLRLIPALTSRPERR